MPNIFVGVNRPLSQKQYWNAARSNWTVHILAYSYELRSATFCNATTCKADLARLEANNWKQVHPLSKHSRLLTHTFYVRNVSGLTLCTWQILLSKVIYTAFKVYVWSVLVLPENWTCDLGIARAIIFENVLDLNDMLHYLLNSLHDISMFYSQDRHSSRLSEHFIPEIIVGVGPSKRRKGQTHAVRWILKTCWYCDSWIPDKLYRSITHTRTLIFSFLKV